MRARGCSPRWWGFLTSSFRSCSTAGKQRGSLGLDDVLDVLPPRRVHARCVRAGAACCSTSRASCWTRASTRSCPTAATVTAIPIAEPIVPVRPRCRRSSRRPRSTSRSAQRVEDVDQAELQTVIIDEVDDEDDDEDFASRQRARFRAVASREALRMSAGGSSDPVRMYLKEIGRVPLLNAQDEVDLAKKIEAGMMSAERLADLEASGEITALEPGRAPPARAAGEEGRAGQVGADAGQPAVGGVDRQAVRGSGHADPGSDPGGQPRI